jgi:hypothetical protein
MGSRRFAECTFCPNCGVDNIERDNYRKDNEPKKNFSGKPEFICLACGFGFLLSPSLRHEHANRMFKEMRSGRYVNDKRTHKPKYG